ncbi:MAG: cyclic nucleotide-binding domain-containing protein [Actinobacteria bacterium]|nr:MAG: cyclic nucleotide-binding domain-containing protein [Actinomycetota bacterium]
MEPVNTPEVAEFLGRFPPFDVLPEDERTAVADSVELRTYVEGENILVEDAEPADHLYVVRDGAVELVHQEEVVDVLEPGECFGHPSLLTGMAPAFTVRAHGGCACYTIPGEQALMALRNPAGARYVAMTLRERLTRTGHTVHALPQLATLRVEELITRPPLFCSGDIAIRTAALIMTENEASAIVVRDGANLFILTDAALRGRVLAADLSPESPVYRVVTRAVTVRPDRLAVDAIIDMLDDGADHLVVVDPVRDVLGVLSAADLMGVETRSPFALRHAILRAADEDQVVAAAQNLRRLFLALLDAGLAPVDIGRVLSLQFDTFTMRLLDLAFEAHGPAPVPWAWLAFGSAARREPHDPNDVVSTSALWRMSVSNWAQVFRDCLESPDRSHLIRANVSFDYRAVAGGLEVTPELVAILRDARNHPDFLRRLARSATDFKPPLGFRGALPDKSFDLKKGGVIPIANLARFHALANGITISSTLDRLVAAQELGALEAGTAAGLREAFEIVARVRLDHHAAGIEAGRDPDNIIDPKDLTPLTRVYLREAFRTVAAAQKQLGVYVPLGM